MSTEHAPTPVEDLRKPKGTQSGNQPVHVTDWCEHHDLHMALMPFDYRDYDPLEACRSIKDTLDDLHPLAQTFMAKDCGISNLAGSKTINPLLQLYGVTKMRDTSKGMRYYNPQYEHYDACIDPIEDTEERLAFYNRFKHNPWLDSVWYGKHFGITQQGVTKWLKRHGHSIQAGRKEARKRLARTLYTIIQWRDDVCQADLCRLMPPKHKTVKVQIRRYARTAEEWQPPERPTHKPWFRSD